MLNNNLLLISSGGVMDSLPAKFFTAPSGRRYTRHSSQKGSIMIYVEDNITRYLLIVDACYRAHALAWDTSPVDLGLRNYGNESITMTRYSGNGSDSILASHFGNKKDAYTARYNTNVLMKRATTDAAHFCRSIVVNGSQCDLPNVQQSLRMHIDANFIDSMDMTSKNNPGTKMTGFDFGACFYASTEASAQKAWYPYNGAVANYSKARALGVVPVLEISGIE